MTFSAPSTELSFVQINPNAWRDVWNEYAPDFNSFMLEMQVNPDIVRAFVMKIVERVSNVNAFNIWQGDVTTTGATYAEFDGLLTKLLAAGGYIDAKPTGTTGSITAANVLDYLADVRASLLAKPGRATKRLARTPRAPLWSTGAQRMAAAPETLTPPASEVAPS